MEPSNNQKNKGDDNANSENPARDVKRNGRLDLPGPSRKRQQVHGGKNVDCIYRQGNEEEDEEEEVGYRRHTRFGFEIVQVLG